MTKCRFKMLQADSTWALVQGSRTIVLLGQDTQQQKFQGTYWRSRQDSLSLSQFTRCQSFGISWYFHVFPKMPSIISEGLVPNKCGPTKRLVPGPRSWHASVVVCILVVADHSRCHRMWRSYHTLMPSLEQDALKLSQTGDHSLFGQFILQSPWEVFGHRSAVFLRDVLVIMLCPIRGSISS
jgi:hypothetical protein